MYVDLVSSQPPVDTFTAHLADHPGEFGAAFRLSPRHRRQIPATAGSTVAADLASRIRARAAQAATRRVHLFLRVPSPIAVLLGCAFNTLEVTLYESDDAPGVARYVPVATVASGRGGGPLVQ